MTDGSNRIVSDEIASVISLSIESRSARSVTSSASEIVEPNSIFCISSLSSADALREMNSWWLSNMPRHNKPLRVRASFSVTTSGSWPRSVVSPKASSAERAMSQAL